MFKGGSTFFSASFLVQWCLKCFKMQPEMEKKISTLRSMFKILKMKVYYFANNWPIYQEVFIPLNN